MLIRRLIEWSDERCCLKDASRERRRAKTAQLPGGQLGQTERSQRLKPHENLREYELVGERAPGLVCFCRPRFVHRELHSTKDRFDRRGPGRVHRGEEPVPSGLPEWPLGSTVAAL